MVDIKNLEIPEAPGIYLMKSGNKVIYVGKAKNLKKRVSSYFNRFHKEIKTNELVKRIESIDFIICNSELDALLLENNYIKKYNPKYNIVLKDQKTYPYIRFSKEEFPKVGIIRTTKTLDLTSGYYFGPYPTGAKQLLNLITRIFKIRDCNRNMEKKYDRPCLKYHMNTCLGPCVYKDDKKRYGEQVNYAKELLRGRVEELKIELEAKMAKASEEMHFEEAIIYRNYLKDLKERGGHQVVELGKAIDEDVFSYEVNGSRLFIYVLGIREGKLIGQNHLNIDLADYVVDELFVDIVTNYYDKHLPAKNIIFNGKNEKDRELLEAWFKVRHPDISIKLYFPKIDSRRSQLLEMGRLNLEKSIQDFYNKRVILEKGIKVLHEELSLKKIPRRIECFDISNIQGKDAVGAMSVALEGRLAKKEYRKFKIKTKDTPDDFHMMREVITRRYSKLEKKDYPDLILIDGGLGQINAVGKILANLDLLKDINLISIAKREEEIFKYGSSEPFIFSRKDEALKILQRLRDEAHRFGITYHRKLRSKRVLKSELDQVAGIGPKRKEKLLKEFGSVDGVKKATLDELKELLPEEVAKEVFVKLAQNQ